MIAIDVQLPGERVYVEIVRRAGDASPDSINTYHVAERSQPRVSERQAKFEHRYGDGWRKCVVRALEALEESG